MKNQYKLTRKEVLKEVVRPVKGGSIKAGKYFGDAIKDNLDLYILPTSFRKNPNRLSFRNNLGRLGIIIQGGIYFLLEREGIPACWVPISLNVASGIYEIGRVIYKKAENRLITKSKNLEKTLREAEE